MSDRPSLAPGVVVKKFTTKDEVYAMVKEPVTRSYYKFEDWEGDFIALLDGTRTLEEIAHELSAKHPTRGLDLQYVVDGLEVLRPLGILERGEQERHLVMMDKLKTLRKKNASVVFATQSLADIDGSAIAPTIIESCPTRIFLPNERSLEPQIAAIYRRFGLNDRQIEILSRATPKREYYCQSRRGNRLFELGLSEVALAFTATSSKSDQSAITECFAQHGRDGFAAAWLRRKDLDWAADMLTHNNREISS